MRYYILMATDRTTGMQLSGQHEHMESGWRSVVLAVVGRGRLQMFVSPVSVRK